MFELVFYSVAIFGSSDLHPRHSRRAVISAALAHYGDGAAHERERALPALEAVQVGGGGC